MKSKDLILKISFIAILSALTFISTVFISIPYAGGAGFFNISDAVIMFSTAYFGPVVGLASGLIGCAFGDLYLGYANCIPFTLLAKGAEVVIFTLLYYYFINKKAVKYVTFFISPLFMVLCYVPYYLIYDDGQGAMALLSSCFDLVQAIAGGILGLIIYLAFEIVKLPYGYDKTFWLPKKGKNS